MAASARAIRDLTNPFDEPLARANSSYASWRDERLVRVADSARPLPPLAQCAHARFRAHVLDPQFSCVGAKAAVTSGNYRFGFYPEMNTAAATAGLAHDLWQFVQDQPRIAEMYVTFVAAFAGPAVGDERRWEELLWSQLQSLHERDRAYHGWDSSVSSDPADPAFSFSFAERGFFVVGMHPASSRTARRFAHPVLVFNSHKQFELLRDTGRFMRVRDTIRGREMNLQGSLNPNLSDHGDASEARQYSGRAVEQDWKCPFRTRLRDAAGDDRADHAA